MKYNKIILALVLCLIIAWSGCKKRNTGGAKNSKCYEQPPTGTTCQAFWQSWVYDPSGDSCAFIGYSGCDPVGFETKQECESCRD